MVPRVASVRLFMLFSTILREPKLSTNSLVGPWDASGSTPRTHQEEILINDSAPWVGFSRGSQGSIGLETKMIRILCTQIMHDNP